MSFEIYEDEEHDLQVTSVYKGKEKGRCLNIYAYNLGDGATLTREQVEELYKRIGYWLQGANESFFHPNK